MEAARGRPKRQETGGPRPSASATGLWGGLHGTAALTLPSPAEPHSLGAQASDARDIIVETTREPGDVTVRETTREVGDITVRETTREVGDVTVEEITPSPVTSWWRLEDPDPAGVARDLRREGRELTQLTSSDRGASGLDESRSSIPDDDKGDLGAGDFMSMGKSRGVLSCLNHPKHHLSNSSDDETPACTRGPAATKQVHACTRGPAATKLVHACTRGPAATKLVHACTRGPAATKLVHACTRGPAATKLVHACTRGPAATKLVHACTRGPAATKLVHACTRGPAVLWLPSSFMPCNLLEKHFNTCTQVLAILWLSS
ncbi:hypothetical protein H8959_011805 [Pygathrix nigripes]